MLRSAALAALLSAAGGAQACGVCVEDKMAAAYDPQRTPVAALQKDLERRLAARKLSLMLLQVMDRPADFSPSAIATMKKETR